MAFQSQAGSDISTKEANLKEELQDPGFSGQSCCCFWNYPCFQTRQPDNWERVSPPEKEQEIAGGLWGKGINTLKKVREWSELVAGPKWKTFIRRFNRATVRSKTGKFQYDPLSYALNFDEGQWQDSQLEKDWPAWDFSARFAAIPVSTKGSMEFGKDEPLFAWGRSRLIWRSTFWRWMKAVGW